MREGIHPEYHAAAKVVCTCKNTFSVGSTLPELRVEVCSNCHPFYTGKQKLVDTRGRVDRYKRILERQTEITVSRRKTKAKQ